MEFYTGISFSLQWWQKVYTNFPYSSHVELDTASEWEQRYLLRYLIEERHLFRNGFNPLACGAAILSNNLKSQKVTTGFLGRY